jgi:hypothetical protein
VAIDAISPGRGALLAASLLIVLPAIATGMGALGSGTPTSIPIPVRNFAVTVVDQQGTKTRLEQFSIEGSVHLSGKRGKAAVAVPFDRIRSARLRSKGGELYAEVLLVDGRTVNLVTNGLQRCFGRMEYANFQIELRDLEELINHGPVGR